MQRRARDLEAQLPVQARKVPDAATIPTTVQERLLNVNSNSSVSLDGLKLELESPVSGASDSESTAFKTRGRAATVLFRPKVHDFGKFRHLPLLDL